MKRKRILSMALCVLLLVSLLPVGALAADDSCAHHPEDHDCGANCDYICEPCVEEIQAMVNDLPEMTAITEEMKSDVAAALTAIQQRYVLVSDAARAMIDFTRFSEAAFVMNTPENFFGFMVTKKYEAGSGPAASFAFLDGAGEPVKLISADGVELSETQPLAGGGSGYYYLPVGTYSVEEHVEGQWELFLSANGVPVDTISGTAGNAYRIMAVNMYRPEFTVGPLTYRISDDGVTVIVVGIANNSSTVDVPVSVEYEGTAYNVSGFEEYLLENKSIITIRYAGTREEWDANVAGVDEVAVSVICHEHSFGSSDTCSCGKATAAVSITLAGGETSYYGTLKEAAALVNAASATYQYTDCTITLLKNVTETSPDLLGNHVKCTLDLGGHTMTDTNSTGLAIHTGATVTVKNGTVTSNDNGIRVNSGAKVTLQGVTAPTYELLDKLGKGTVVTVDQSCSLTSHVRMYGGELVLAGMPSIAGFGGNTQLSFEGGIVTLACDPGSTVYRVSCKAVSFPYVFAQPGENIVLSPQNFAPADAGYYVGYAADGKLALYEGVCEHAYFDSENRCTVCGVAAVATVTVGEGEPVYHVEYGAAISEWKDNSTNPGEKTLTLLAPYQPGGTIDYIYLPAAKRALDLNGFTFRRGHGFRLNGTELSVRDGSAAAAGVYAGQIALYGENSKLTLESGTLNGNGYSAISVDENASGAVVTVKGGEVTASDRAAIVGGPGTINVEGGLVNSQANTYSAIKGGSVTICGDAVVSHGSPNGIAVKAESVSIQGAPAVGTIAFLGTNAIDLSGYTGEGQDVCFKAEYTPGNSSGILLGSGYGFHDADNNVLASMSVGDTARVQKIHVHNWSGSAEGNVITVLCTNEVGVCKAPDRKVTLTLKAPADLVYDGSEKSCTVEKSAAGILDLTGCEVEYSSVPVGVGSYTADFTYGGATAEIAFSIAAIDISGMAIEPLADKTYTGKAIEPAVTIDGLTEGRDFTVAYADNTNAGTATVTVTGIGNYGGSLTENFSILPAEITVTAALDKEAYKYSGSVVEPEVSVTTKFNEVDMNLAGGMDYSIVYGQETAAGNIVPVTVKPRAGGNFTFEEVTLYYSIEKAVPTHTVPTGLTAVYGDNMYEVSLPSAENGRWVWRVPTFSVGAVGSQRHSVVFIPNDQDNYESVYVDVDVEVKPAVLTVTGVNIQGKTYDGSDQVAVSSLIINGRVGSDDVTIAGLSTLKATAPSANAGSYTEITLPTLTLTGADSGNYTLVQPGKVPASYTIARKAVYPVVEVAAGTYRYNGMAQTPTVTVRDGAAVIPAEEYTVSYSSNLHVGTGYATVSDKEGGNYDLTQVTGSFTIQTTTITITADNKSATTGQKAPALTYTVTGLVAGEKLSKEPTVSYVTTPDMSKAGTTLIRAGGAVAPSSDYTISYVDGTLTVIKASSSGGSYTGSYTGNVSVTVDMSDVELVSKTYDGKPISFGGKASARYYTGNFTYTWYTASGYKLSEAPTDAGDYTLRATVNRSGYTGYASKNVTIRKAALTITADDLRANVGDAAPKLSYSVKGLGSGDKLKTEPQLSYEKEPDMTKPGEVPIIVSGAEAPDTKNYEKDIRYIEGTLTIGEAEPEEEKTSEERGEPAEPAEPMRKLEVSVGSASPELEKALDSKDCAYYELALRESADGGANWAAAGSQLPEGGVQVSLPLPEGSDENCSFRVVHADGEYPATLVRKEDGKWYLEFTAAELGSVAVGWTAPGKEGGFPWWLLPLLAVGGGVVGIVCNRKRRRSY